jgi:drug/metabolite transporter (DMT)-like permease
MIAENGSMDILGEAESAVFGLASAMAWGAGDFCGGLATKRTSVLRVVVGSQTIGVGSMILLAILTGEAVPGSRALAWGAASGLAGAVGLIALYSALAKERMGLAAPVSGVLSAALPVAVTAVATGLPGPLTLAGFVLALVAVWLVSRSEGAAFQIEALGLPVLAGLGFGGFIVLIAQAGPGAVFWPLVAARCASLLVLTAVAIWRHESLWPAREHWPVVGASGVFDAGGNAFLVLAAHAGRLDVAAVLSSLYPATTVLLARWILNERLTWGQTLGLLAALVAIAAITIP